MNQSNKSYSDAAKSFQLMTNKKKPEKLWELGENLTIIRNSDEYTYWLWTKEDDIESFHSYLESDDFQLNGEKIPFEMSAKCIERYMKIYELISLDVLQSIPNTLAEHLYALIEVDEQTRNNILEAMCAIEREYPVSNIAKHKKLRSLYRTNDIKVMLPHFQSNNHCLTSQAIKKLIFNHVITPRINLKPNNKEKYRWGEKDIIAEFT